MSIQRSEESLNGVSIYTKCKQPILLAKAIYTNSAH